MEPVQPIEPDTKDWTWVLERPCGECGFDAASVDRAGLPSAIRRNAAIWLEVLARADVRRRPAPQTWSPLEYGCHVRDVYRLFDRRLKLMLDEPDPLFDNWDQDETALAERYWEQDPVLVSPALLEAADTIAHRFATVDDDRWARTGRRSNGSVFTIETFAHYLMHDLVHHVHDVGA